MKRINRYTIYLLFLSIGLPAAFLSAQEKDFDFNVEWTEEDTKFYEKKTLYIKHADQIQSSSQKDKAGYTLTHLDGNVFIIFEDKKIFSDQMTIKMFDDKAEEIIASGNVLIESDKSITIGQKFFFYPNKKTGIVYLAETYNKPYFIRGEYFKFKDENKLIALNMTFSNCENPYPHYSIGAVKGWVYKGEQDFFLGFSIRAGEDPIFFFPFMQRSYYGTGLITALGKEDGAGWFVHNTYKTKGNNYDVKVMFDHYQKTGEYYGVEYTRTDIGTLTLKEAAIYDRHVKYESGNFKNYFEEVPGEKPTSGRSVRYKTDDTYEKSFQITNDISTTIKGHFYSHSDPFINSQYESSRKETFDPSKILFPDAANSSLAGSFSSGSGSGKQMDFSMRNSFYGYNLDIAGNWSYSMAQTNDPQDNKNPYKPEYYKNYKQTVLWPSIALSKNFTLFDPFVLFASKPQNQMQSQMGSQAAVQISGQPTIQSGQQPAAQVSGTQNSQQPNVWTFAWPFALNVTTSYKETKSYILDVISSDNVEQKVDLNFSMPFSIKKGIFTFSIPFAVNNSNLFTNVKAYNTGILNTDIDTSDLNINATYPIVVELKWPYASFKTGVDPFNFTYLYHKQATQYMVAGDSVLADKQGTSTTKTYNIGNDTKFSFFQDYEYLESYIQTKITYQYSIKEGEVIQDTKTKIYTYSATLSTLKSSVTIDTSDNFSDNIAPQNRKGSLNIKTETHLIPYVTLSDTYSYDRFYEQSKTNSFGMDVKVGSKLYFSRNIWLNSFSFNTSWTRNYDDEMSNFLTYNFTVDFNVTRLWQISITTSGKNEKLYYYYDNTYTRNNPEKKKNIWEDLYKSVKFWSTKDRMDSDFKMSSFGLSVKHDLHKWVLEFQSTFTPQKDRSGAFYFESFFALQLTLLDLSGFFAPKRIEKRFGQQY